MTATQTLALKPNVVIQPLIDRWYAWSHLVPPATLALNHLERHLRIMDSYVQAPELHAAAVEDPAMLGGPFLDLEGKRTEDVKALAEHIRRRCAGLLEVAQALKDLSSMLRENARGYCLDPLYDRVPRPLRGFVELVYDLEHRPGFRLIEPLVYQSPYYDESSQGLALFEVRGDDRPFVLSTPSLNGSDRLHLDVPFASHQVDALAQLKWEPQPLAHIREELGLDADVACGLTSFLTASPPPPASCYDGPGMRWRYFGHGCVLVERRGTSVLTDPVVAYAPSASVPRYTFHDLPETIDCLLITHAHQDHTMLETLLQLRHRARTVVVPRSSGGSLQDPSLKLLLRQVGFRHVIEVEELDEIDLGPLIVRAVPFVGEHADLDIRAKTTYLVEGGGRRLYFGADTCNVEPHVYRIVRDAVGPVDTIFLGMECDGAPLDWLYGPLLMAPKERESWRMKQSRRLSGSDATKAVEMVRTLGARQAFVYSMGQEPWLKYLLSLQYEPDSLPIIESDKFVSWCRTSGIESERLFGQREMCVA